jgi:hypothetical protein
VVNERLRQAILDADLYLEDLAGGVGTDPKTAEQWVTRGRVCRRPCRRSTPVGAGRSGSTRPAEIRVTNDPTHLSHMTRLITEWSLGDSNP